MSNVFGLEYIASYTDLMNAFGTNWAAGENHWHQVGHLEGRNISFDGLEYIASYGDLISALRNADYAAMDNAGATHYIQSGRFEGRSIAFDGLEYIASYGDLINAFRSEVAAIFASAYLSEQDPVQLIHDTGSLHFIQNGHSEGRTVSFDPVQYLAKYADLQAAFGSDTEAATLHYITTGYAEGRTDDPI